MNANHASGLLLLLSTAALGCDSGTDDTDAGTTSGTTGASMTTGDASGSTTADPSTTTSPASTSGTSTTDASGSSDTTGAEGSSGSGSGSTGTSGSPLCNEHGNVVEKCTEASYDYGVGYCEYAIEAGAEYSAECGEAWEALFGCINGVDCKDFGIVGVPGCEAEEKKLNSVCP